MLLFKFNQVDKLTKTYVEDIVKSDIENYTLLLLYDYDKDENVKSFLKNFGGASSNWLDSVNMYTAYDKETFDEWCRNIRGEAILNNQDFSQENLKAQIKFMRDATSYYKSKGMIKSLPVILVFDKTMSTTEFMTIELEGKSPESIYDEVYKFTRILNEHYNDFSSISSEYNVSRIKSKNTERLDSFLEKKSRIKIIEDIIKKGIKKKGMLYSDLAEQCGMVPRTLQLKRANLNFRRDDILMIANVLELSRIETNKFLKAAEYAELSAVELKSIR